MHGRLSVPLELTRRRVQVAAVDADDPPQATAEVELRALGLA